jgi:Sulfotransferase domain
MRPELFLVGAPKAGTSALAVFLAQHPQIAMCRIKEPNFHCPDLDLPGPRGEREYLDLFEPGPETRFLADASVLYLYSREAARRIRAFAPDARIVMVLREPVQAMYAWHGQMVYTGNEPITDFATALEAEEDRKRGRRLPAAGTGRRSPALLFYRDVMRYADQVPRFLDAFPREQVAIRLYDDFLADPERFYDGLIEFLGLRPFRPALRSVNPPRERRAPRLHRLMKRLLAAPAREMLPARIRLDWIQRWDRLTSRAAPRAPLAPALAADLRAGCRSDVLRLAECIDRDLSAWRA